MVATAQFPQITLTLDLFQGLQLLLSLYRWHRRQEGVSLVFEEKMPLRSRHNQRHSLFLLPPFLPAMAAGEKSLRH